MPTRNIFTKALIAELIILICALGIPAQSNSTAKPAAPFVAVTEYNPKRDASADLAAAIKEAARTHKNVLVEVGGNWCSWCHTLDKFFAAHAELTQLRDKNFVLVKINFSDENNNVAVLSRYPQIEGYPHIFFLDSKGKLLRSQDTGTLEDGRSYSLERLTTVLTKWGPKGSTGD